MQTQRFNVPKAKSKQFLPKRVITRVNRCYCFAFSLASTLISPDVNECDDNPNYCQVRGRCVNTPGSYRCVCEQGYEVGNGGSRCIGKRLFTGDSSSCVSHVSPRYMSRGMPRIAARSCLQSYAGKSPDLFNLCAFSPLPKQLGCLKKYDNINLIYAGLDTETVSKRGEP